MTDPGHWLHTVESVAYRKHRPQMRAGDLIAFSGDSLVSLIIQRFTRNYVSHVGVIMRVSEPDSDRDIVQLCESTTLTGGFSGVQTSRLSVRLEQYEGAAWWLPMDAELREHFDEAAFFAFLLHHALAETTYDMRQAVRSCSRWFDRLLLSTLLGENLEDFALMFCSELYIGAMKAGLGKLGYLSGVNASHVNPALACQIMLHGPEYQPLRGPDWKFIHAYNTVTPAVFHFQ